MDNPIVIYWLHDALSNNETMLTDYNTTNLKTKTADNQAILIIGEHADGTREIINPAYVANPSTANTQTNTTTKENS